MEASQAFSVYAHAIIMQKPYSPCVLYREDDCDWFDQYIHVDPGLVHISVLFVFSNDGIVHLTAGFRAAGHLADFHRPI